MATMRSGGRPSMRAPSNQIAPADSFTSPEMARRVVLLPAPLAPMMVTIESSSTLRLIPFSAATFW
jgi:hypothetical protein